MTAGAVQLDTSFLIRALIAGTAEDTMLRSWLNEDRKLAMSAVAWTEFLCGPVNAEELFLSTSIISDPLPFTGEMSSLAAGLYNKAGRLRGSLADCMIAASAITESAALATLNRQDFEKFRESGLTLL